MKPTFVLLYVDSPEKSGKFYSEILGLTPVETSPTFNLFALDHGYMLGLWSKHTVEPAPGAEAGAAELGFPVGDPEEVVAIEKKWREMGVTIVQTGTELDFGYTFCGLDLDGHRLRVFAPNGS